MREEQNCVSCAVWSCQAGDLSLSGGSGVSWDQHAELRPLVISEVVKLRRGPRLAGVGARGSSWTSSSTQLDAARGQLDGSKLLRLPGEQEGQVPRHGVFSRPYQSQLLRGEVTGGPRGASTGQVESRQVEESMESEKIELGVGARVARPWSDLDWWPGQEGGTSKRGYQQERCAVPL